MWNTLITWEPDIFPNCNGAVRRAGACPMNRRFEYRRQINVEILQEHLEREHRRNSELINELKAVQEHRGPGGGSGNEVVTAGT